jgi:hypothetical protein
MSAIIELIKRYGIKKVLMAISEYLRDQDLRKDQQLGKDIRDALKRYEQDED